jgi:hypothetical protein
MIDVRAQIESTFLRKHDVTSFIQGLEALHVLALIGRSGRSFYRPSSPIVGKSGARAGTLYDVPTRTVRDLELTLFIDGPRVSSPFVGGRRYHEMLYRSLDDPGALDREREIRDEHALAWGQVAFGLARTDDDASHWFIPPRPLCHAHLEGLCSAFNAALAESRLGTASPTTHLAAFHWAFIRLHPFACANQSIAMNLVNALLKLRGRLPVPHLILDQLALRLTRAAHALAFERAVNGWTMSPPASVPRAIHLMQQRAVMDRLLSQLDQAPSLVEAEKIAQNDPSGARLLLLR